MPGRAGRRAADRARGGRDDQRVLTGCRLDTHRRRGVEAGAVAIPDLQLQQAETPELRPLLDRFSVLLKVHVKLEEGAFFPFIERTLSIEELQLAEREIDAGHIVNCSSWPDPFWKSRS